ncbi:BQ5605_C011g06429 [Microbotryum silenes-dioicae]|uniref:Signal peptidase subunit 3 n=1 Tax=Microbotryum silenes-dioicae TaxID=796604 RepID=A0A2X0NSY1_9BASI|nr:BQ5605_C011g06429 [Microbotryum silenes-dioicae]
MSAHYSATQRLNSATALTSTVLVVLLSLVSLSCLLLPVTVTNASLRPSHVNVVLGRSGYERYPRASEFAFVKYDLVADLSPLFNWNTKQVFVYLVAEYDTYNYASQKQNTPNNAVVLWDRIVRNKKYATINLSNGKQKYEFKEITDTFRNVSATFSLRYQIQPHVGKLIDGEVIRTEKAFDFPPVQRQVTG